MNGREKKTGLLFSICISFFFMACLSWLWLYTCRQAAYEPISAFCRIMVEANPETEQQVFSALKEFHALTGPEIAGDRFLASYGYTVREFCKGYPLPALALSFALLLAILCVFLIIILRTDKKNRRRIDGLTDYLEQVNADAGGTVLQMREDDFSRLQDELYKTVTALRQTREDAVAAKKRFAENLENIAHQLKTPITAACLSLELMKRTYPDAHAEQIEKQLGRLNRLEESLLTLSKIDAGTLPFCRTTVDIYTALTLAAENVSGLLQKENVSISIPDNGCVEFSGDLEWTMEALINLLKNCMEHSQPGGTVHCDYSENPLYARIRIWDEGAGFDPADIPHLFERFYRGRRAAGNGIGIGLALSRSIFALQNGTIAAYNREEGGACFEIRVYW